MSKEDNMAVDEELAEEIAEGAELPKPVDIKVPEKPKPSGVGGFVKAADQKESTYNGLNLWTATYDQWFEILVSLGKNSKLCTGTTKSDFCVDGIRLWSSIWEEKYAMLEKLVK